MWPNSKKINCDKSKRKQIGTKLQNLKCDKYQKLKLWHKTQKINLGQNWKTQIVAKVIGKVVTVRVVTVVVVTYFSKNNLTPWQSMRCSRCSFSWFLWCFWYWCYYLHRSRDALCPVCKIFWDGYCFCKGHIKF